MVWILRGVFFVVDFIGLRRKKQMMSEMVVIQLLMKKYGYRENGYFNGNGIDGGIDDDFLLLLKINSDVDFIVELFKDDIFEVLLIILFVIFYFEFVKDGEESFELRMIEEFILLLEEEKLVLEYDDR